MLNQRPAPGLTNCAFPAAASEIPVAPAVPFMVSLVPTAANTCAAAAPLLMTVTSWPPRAGGRATLSAAVAHTAMRLNAAVRGYAAARVPPAVAVIPFWNDAIPAGSNSCGPRLYDMRCLLTRCNSGLVSHQPASKLWAESCAAPKHVYSYRHRIV